MPRRYTSFHIASTSTCMTSLLKLKLGMVNSKNIQSVMYVGPRVLLHKRISHRNIHTTLNSSISTRLLPSISNMLKAISNPLFGSATEKTSHNNATWRMETIFTKWLVFFTKLTQFHPRSLRRANNLNFA